MYGIDIDAPMKYVLSSMRFFAPHEHHISRKSGDNVLLMVYEGILRFEEDGKEYEISPGEWYIQRCGGIQTGRVESDCPKYLYIHFLGEWTEKENALPAGGNFPVHELMPLMERMDNAAHHQGSLTECCAAFYSILSELIRLSRAPISPAAAEIVNLLTKDLSSPPSLSELSSACHISKNQIIRIIKREFGITPYAYLTKERLREAARLLESTSEPLSAIAEKIGFSEYSHFFRSFKQAYNMSPGEWRSQQRNFMP